MLDMNSEENDMIDTLCSSHKPASLFFNASNIDYKDFKRFISATYNITITVDYIHDKDKNSIHLKLTKIKNLIEVDDDVYINPDEMISTEITKVKKAIDNLNIRYSYVSKSLEDTKKRIYSMSPQMLSHLT